MASFDFNEFKKKAAETAGTIADKSAEVAKLVAMKAELLAKKAKLSADIAGERGSLRRKYQELGKLYYAEHGATPDAGYAAACEKITAAKAIIQANNDRIAQLKAEAKASGEELDAKAVEEAVETELVTEAEEPSTEPEDKDSETKSEE